MNWRLRALVAVLFAGMIALAGGSTQASSGVGDARPDMQQVGSGRGTRGIGARGGQHRGHFQGVFRELLRVVSQATGLRPRELAAQVQQGRTLADLIRANNGSVDEVTREATAIIGERIQQSAETGRLSQARAAALIAELPQRINEVLNGDRLSDRGAEQRLVRGVLHLAAEQTGLSPRELREQLSSHTLAEVLASNDIQSDWFIETAVSQLVTRLNARIAERRLTREQAEAMVSDFRMRLAELLNGALWV